MKNTGMIRKVDELGRIVIPKEIRHSLHINVGNPMQLFINENNEVVLKKINEFYDLENSLQVFVKVLNKQIDKEIIIVDLKNIICYCGKNLKFNNKKLSEQLLELLKNKKSYTADLDNKTTIIPLTIDDCNKYNCQLIIPIVKKNIVFGAIIVADIIGTTINNTDIICATLIVNYITEKLI